jgi:thiaminase/transcriptional activator TenA
MAVLTETTFCERVRDATRSIWERQLQHPFVLALCDGTLPRDVFEFYIRQDARFLDDLSRSFGYAVAKATDQAEMEQFGQMVLDTLTVERALHQAYAEKFGVTVEDMASTPMAPTNFAYTRHILYQAASGSMAALITAVLPCAWIYAEVGTHFTTVLGGLPHDDHPYRDWIGTYASPEFEKVGAWLRARLEEKTRSLSPAELQHLEDIFVTSSRFEFMFWDMAWRKETWPV